MGLWGSEQGRAGAERCGGWAQGCQACEAAQQQSSAGSQASQQHTLDFLHFSLLQRCTVGSGALERTGHEENHLPRAPLPSQGGPHSQAQPAHTRGQTAQSLGEYVRNALPLAPALECRAGQFSARTETIVGSVGPEARGSHRWGGGGESWDMLRVESTHTHRGTCRPFHSVITDVH